MGIVDQRELTDRKARHGGTPTSAPPGWRRSTPTMPRATPRTAATTTVAGPSVADALRPLIAQLLGQRLPVRFAFWDGSVLEPPAGAPGIDAVVRIRSVEAVRRILWAPGEIGLARAFVAGDIEIDGDIFGALRALSDVAVKDTMRLGVRAFQALVQGARRVGALRLPPPPPAEEVRPRGPLHSPGRDAQAVSHHYDVGNDFYELVLGPSMTYSCARFGDAAATLEEAQGAKHELISRKLGLHEKPGARLLDVGCGWGSMALHAATRHDAVVVGVTLSVAQAGYARRRVADAGLSDRIEIRLQDYRDLRGETFDAVSSIGMFEHVGSEQMGRYFDTLRTLLVPTGRLLNHAISSPGGSKVTRRTFIGRYVFPDSELEDVGDVVLAMERRRLRSPRRRVVARALLADPPRLGGQSRIPLGRGGRTRRCRPGAGLAAVHGRLRRRVRRRGPGDPPGPGRCPGRGRVERYAGDPATAGPSEGHGPAQHDVGGEKIGAVVTVRPDGGLMVMVGLFGSLTELPRVHVSSHCSRALFSG